MWALVFGAGFGEFLKHRTLIHFYKSAYSISNSSWFHKMSKNHLYLAIDFISRMVFDARDRPPIWIPHIPSWSFAIIRAHWSPLTHTKIGWVNPCLNNSPSMGVYLAEFFWPLWVPMGVSHQPGNACRASSRFQVLRPGIPAMIPPQELDMCLFWAFSVSHGIVTDDSSSLLLTC